MLFSSELRDLFYSMHIYSVKSETHSASGWLIAVLDGSYHRSLWRVRNLICQPRGRKKGQVQKSEAILPFFMVDQNFGWKLAYLTVMMPYQNSDLPSREQMGRSENSLALSLELIIKNIAWFIWINSIKWFFKNRTWRWGSSLGNFLTPPPSLSAKNVP